MKKENRFGFFGKLLDELKEERQKMEAMSFIDSLLYLSDKSNRNSIFRDLINAKILTKIELLSKTTTVDTQLNNLTRVFFEIHEEYEQDMKNGENSKLESAFFFLFFSSI